MSISRRKFLAWMGAAGTATAVGRPAGATKNPSAAKEFVSALVDTTLCIGCRRCEKACAEVNQHPVPDPDDKSVFDTVRKTMPDIWTVVNRYHTERGIVTVKRQCMHCNQAACVAACLVKAMYKLKEGPVIWRGGGKCMGCRYCMLSCPFDMPKFEYDKAIPDIAKCHFCHGLQNEGKKPACIEACPVEAMRFGSRRQLLKIAKSRIAAKPDQYYPHIYGEHEAGGTGWFYLSSVPFNQIGFKTSISTRPYPEFTKGFLYGVPIVFVLWPTFLAGISLLTKRKKEAGHQNEIKKEEVQKE